MPSSIVIVAVGILILGFGIGTWLLIRWALRKDAKARVIAAKKTEAEIKVERAEVRAEEEARSDQSAWNEFNDHH